MKTDRANSIGIIVIINIIVVLLGVVDNACSVLPRKVCCAN